MKTFIFVVVALLILFGWTVHHRFDPKTWDTVKIGTVEGCNIYHMNGPFGGATFAVCHH